MKKLMKITASAIAAVMMLGAMPVFADVINFIAEPLTMPQPAAQYDETYDDTVYDTDYDAYEVYDAADEVVAPQANFLSVAGRVVEISNHYDNDNNPIYGAKSIRIEGEAGPAILRTTMHTHILGDEIEIGDDIMAWYASGPMMLPYPPQHTVRLIVNGEFTNVKIDRFHLDEGRQSLVSADGMLQINFDNDTPIILQDGSDFRQNLEDIRADYEQIGIEPSISLDVLGALDGRTLVVTYGASTRSIPAITIPGIDSGLKIIVLFEEAVHPIGEVNDFGLALIVPPIYELTPGEWPINQIVVHGEITDATWQVIDGVYFVPFRVVVDALGHGHSIVWDGAARSITVSNGSEEITFTIGDTYYHINREIKELAPPSVIIGDRTYVPFKFFQDIFGLNNAWIHGGQIIFDNEERME